MITDRREGRQVERWPYVDERAAGVKEKGEESPSYEYSHIYHTGG